MKDYELLKNNPNIKYVSPNDSTSFELKLLDPRETKTANVTGITPDYKEIQNQTLLYGRYINDNDIDEENKVCLINDTTAEKVFGKKDESVIGERVSLKTWRGTQKYTIVGLLQNDNAALESQYGDAFPETLYVPVSALLRFNGEKRINSFTALFTDPNTIDDVSPQITDMLNAAHKTTDKYYIQNMMNIAEQITSATKTMTMLIGSIAAISLVVGGIGVMNIMLVTVTERTREIGIRKSIGAQNKNILMQFLIEAIILTGIGGALGLLLGYFGGSFAGKAMSITTVMSLNSVLLAVGVSIGIGVIFGVFPAYKAAKLDPIDALRYE
ncbi:ABC transporter permease [Clostridia bacterium]|nr:ABC transporter permease [Clostridia bacterium]